MVRRRHNFPALAKRALTDSLTQAVPVDGWWEPGYADAIERALAMRDFQPLLRLLDQRLPVHPAMLPALADAIRSLDQGKRAGKPPKLTTEDRRLIAHAIASRAPGTIESAAIADQAAAWNVSPDTIKRALKTRPA